MPAWAVMLKGGGENEKHQSCLWWFCASLTFKIAWGSLQQVGSAGCVLIEGVGWNTDPEIFPKFY